MRSSMPANANRNAPPVKCELPPRSSNGAASSIRTRAPCSCAEIAAQSAALPAPITSTSGRCWESSMEFMIERALRVGTLRVEWLDGAGGVHGRQHVARISKLVERGAEPQHRLGRLRIKRAARTVTELGFERARRQRMITVAAESRLDEVLECFAGCRCDPHPRIEMIASRAPEIGVRLRIHFGSEGARGVLAHRLVGEVLEAHDAVHQRAPKHVLDAKLAVETAPRIGPVGVRKPARMRPRFNLRDAVGRKRMRLAQMQHGVRGRMGRAAARVTLEGYARLGEIERLCPFG